MIGKQTILAAALGLAAAIPAHATTLPAGAMGVTFTDFGSTAQGTLLASEAVTGSSGPVNTFSGTLYAAVYRTAAGTLDFYYQFTRSGGTDDVERITAGSVDGVSGFAGYDVQAFYSDDDLDGSGIFSAASTAGADATASRVSNGSTLGVNFDAANPISGTETSAVYIFRTNATDYVPGTFSVQDGQTFAGMAYAPAAVPEVSTWAMMVLGFGAAGAAVRRSRRTRVVFA